MARSQFTPTDAIQLYFERLILRATNSPIRRSFPTRSSLISDPAETKARRFLCHGQSTSSTGSYAAFSILCFDFVWTIVISAVGQFCTPSSSKICCHLDSERHSEYRQQLCHIGHLQCLRTTPSLDCRLFSLLFNELVSQKRYIKVRKDGAALISAVTDLAGGSWLLQLRPLPCRSLSHPLLSQLKTISSGLSSLDQLSFGYDFAISFVFSPP